MLEEFIYFLLENRRKIFGGIVGFVVSILLISVGFISTIFIIAMTVIGYKFGNMDYKILIEKIKNILSSLLNKIDTN